MFAYQRLTFGKILSKNCFFTHGNGISHCVW